ncbi:calcium-binding protein [Rubellimicrobium roseum]|uniref:Calcium-binding protein n=1 Tax=Rubellimicrobium roseum TaxID=687525 RepID=A0A5C4NFB9_9RHOB|nr:calcium-binding protein [Rubellimicrobium roseum]TNC73474.1 calcium-binding protein [Rubellimicrobium roseum]
MPASFTFDANDLASAGFLETADLTTGSGPGIDYPAYRSALGYGAVDYVGDVDVVALTMVAGQTYVFDIDDGYGDASGGSVDLQLDLIDHAGRLIATSDNPSSGRDPFLSLTATMTGTYFVAVHHTNNDYIDGFHAFQGGDSGVGDYRLAISTPVVATLTSLTAYGDIRSFSDAAQTVRALGGNDTLRLGGGNDVGQGGTGQDLIYGGAGKDDLSGGTGADRLWGEGGNDVLNGGADGDLLSGGTERDALNGNAGHDQLYGGSGDDTLWGQAGNDALVGDGGNDLLRGGEGMDRLTGGAGADSFHFLRGDALYDSAGYDEDRIADFQTGDRIDLSDLLLGLLTWRGASGFSAANQVRIADFRGSIGYQEVQVNLDSDSTPEFALLVDTIGDRALLSSDFFL